MAITMHEIAKKLNLSIATVSRTLSGKADGVSEETKRTVLEAAARYGYKKRRTIGKSVAFVIDKDLFNLSSQFYASIISGVEEELIKSKYYFQFNSLEKENFDLTRINLNFSDLAGVILIGVYHDDFVLKLKDIAVPMVLVDYYIPTEDIPVVLIDNTDGILKGAKYLAGLGHRRVAFIAGDRADTATHDRLYGYTRSCVIYGFEQNESLIEECRGRLDESFAAMNRLLKRKPHPTAVMAHNDIIAIGAMDAIKQKGLSVPHDISVMGFDDIGLASEVVPPLTTLHVPKRAMGSMAVQRLLQVIKGEIETVNKLLLPTELVVRSSTAAPST